ncbi:MAG: hypothetical protein RLY57_597, partial [Candidatus Parcubacteria bacterium]
MQNIAKKIFDSYNNFSDIQKLIKEKTSENLYLEFKEKRNRSIPDLDKEDKFNFSDALSQFANSDGGVIIFGIRTSKPNDFASDLKPISMPDEFMKRLLDYQLYAVQPFVENVEAKIIMDKDNTGYILICIPSSLKTPHRSMCSREYYKRGQNGKYKLEHFDLEDIFGRRQKPLLSIEIKNLDGKKSFADLIDDNSDRPFLGKIPYTIFIHNDGSNVAKNSIVILTVPSEQFAK